MKDADNYLIKSIEDDKPRAISQLTTKFSNSPIKSNATSVMIAKKTKTIPKKQTRVSPKNDGSFTRSQHKQKDYESRFNLSIITKKLPIANKNNNRIPIVTQDLKKNSLNKTLSSPSVSKGRGINLFKASPKYKSSPLHENINTEKSFIFNLQNYNSSLKKDKNYKNPALTTKNSNKEEFDFVSTISNASNNSMGSYY